MQQYKLTRDNVRRLVMHALFSYSEAEKDAEGNPIPPSNAICADGIKSDFGFNPARINDTREELLAMLPELDEEFLSEDGFSFLFLGFRSDGTTWANQSDGTTDWSALEGFVCLAIALGHAKYTVDRPLWIALPGRAPFVRFSVAALPATIEA